MTRDYLQVEETFRKLDLVYAPCSEKILHSFTSMSSEKTVTNSCRDLKFFNKSITQKNDIIFFILLYLIEQ